MLPLTYAVSGHNICESCRYFRQCIATCANEPPPTKVPSSLKYGPGRKWASCEEVAHNYSLHYGDARAKWARYYAEDMASVAKPLAELLKAASAEQDVSAKVESAELCEPGSSTCAGFPRVVHQSWRSTELPGSLAEWQRTWAEMNPGYTLRLWTDANNERFIAQHYPWFLRYFRQYDKMIKRADAVRPFYLYHFGGVYADLDFACIRPFDALLQRHASSQVLLGELQKGAHESQSVPNALMISKPRARFWLLVMRELVRRVNCADPMFDTGPAMLTKVARTEGHASGVTVLNSSHFYSISWNLRDWARVERGDRVNITAMRAVFTKAAAIDPSIYAVTSWMHSWDWRWLPYELRTEKCARQAFKANCAMSSDVSSGGG